ncbi:SDR family oxidoreductase [Kribbella sp.]|uniref:SDR family oxidoreductase n=1 Tax=Kribbella sp. TaxID=1871183 RepID=UPI002D39B6F3|nr:NAD(P)H-binding protein [Kribbella sp.]HZX02044.1 NAD(P)H-binding protein [Kribbella sp.]
MTTLVIGARGAVGRHVVDGLLAAGTPVRASVRDLAKADFAPGVDVVQADLTQPDTLPAALDGVDQVFLYAEPSGAADFGKAASAAGVERVVLLSSGSVLVPWATSNPITVEHRTTEELLAGSGPELVAVRPLVLANNARNWAWSIRSERVVRLVYPGSVSAPIHERDIAEVALAALSGTDPREVSALLTGSEPLTLRDQVGLIGAAIGASVTVEEIDEARAREMFGVGEPETVEAILHFVRRGTEESGWFRTDVAERVLGRPPLRFAVWAREHAAEFR